MEELGILLLYPQQDVNSPRTHHTAAWGLLRPESDKERHTSVKTDAFVWLLGAGRGRQRSGEKRGTEKQRKLLPRAYGHL